MSKVIHLSDDAHNKAKAFCREHGLKMSDWVAGLIDVAISSGISRPASVMASDNNAKIRALVQKKKLEERFEPTVPTDDIVAAPPFWQQRAR